MEFVTLDFPDGIASKMASLGLQVYEFRGTRHLTRASTFESPCTVSTLVNDWCELKIGAFTLINHGGRISDLHVGRYSSIAAEVVIGTHEHPTNWLTTARFAYQPDLHNWYQQVPGADLAELRAVGRTYEGFSEITTIGNDVWVGLGSYIKNGVTIGDGAVIGARSVVTKDVPPYAVVAGVPAQVRKMRFPEHIVERLLALRWWRYSLLDLYDVPLQDVEKAIDVIEQREAAGALRELTPKTFSADDLAAVIAAARQPENPTAR